MFVAVRDLVFARGRFALMGGVVALITLLVVLLSGLTAGLARENTSAVLALPGDEVVFAAPAEGQSPSFAESQIPDGAADLWADTPGVQQVEPLQIRTSRLTVGERSATVAAFAVPAGSTLVPADVPDGQVLLPETVADELDVAAGDEVTINGEEVLLGAVGGEDAYSHLPVAWLPGGLAAGGGDQHADAATVLVLGTDQLADADRQATDAAAGTETLPLADSVQALPSFSSENGSLQLMRGLLLVISALVIGAFFTVWTVQRSGEIAVLKAVGASTGYLLRDALGQALVLLVLGTGLGAGAATGLGLLAAGTVPFVLDVATVAVPVLSLVALGLLGAAVSLRQIVSVDPLTALGSAR